MANTSLNLSSNPKIDARYKPLQQAFEKFFIFKNAPTIDDETFELKNIWNPMEQKFEKVKLVMTNKFCAPIEGKLIRTISGKLVDVKGKTLFPFYYDDNELGTIAMVTFAEALAELYGWEMVETEDEIED